MRVNILWHHLVTEGDEFPHVFGRPTDCYCEPEVSDLGWPHKVVKHQDMSRMEVKNHG